VEIEGRFVFRRKDILFRDLRGGSFQSWFRKTSYHFVQEINVPCIIEYKATNRGSSLLSIDEASQWGWVQEEEGWVKDFNGLKVISKIHKVFKEGTTPIKGWWRAEEREFVIVDQDKIDNGTYSNFDTLMVSITPHYHQIGYRHVLDSSEISSQERELYNEMKRDEDGRKVIHTRVTNDFTLVVKGYC